jgi:hypothetical protein
VPEQPRDQLTGIDVDMLANVNTVRRGGGMAVLPRSEGSTDHGGRRLGRRTRWLVYVLAPLVVVPLAMLVLPVPGLDGYLTRVATERVVSGLACPGQPAPSARIRFTGGRLLPQLLRGRLSGIQLSLPDVTIGGVRHAAFTATLRDVSQPRPGTTHVGSMDASITIGFANMPSPPDGSSPTYGRSPDGFLTIEVIPTAEVARKVKATMFLRLDLHGNTLTPVPQRLLLFGHMVPATQVATLTGGLRPQTLPPLPAGVTYKSITTEKDGLHVALGGIATTPLSALPTTVNGQTVSYAVENGLLGISSTRNLPLVGSIPLTILTEPRLDGGTLTLVPRSVKILAQTTRPTIRSPRSCSARPGRKTSPARCRRCPAGFGTCRPASTPPVSRSPSAA